MTALTAEGSPRTGSTKGPWIASAALGVAILVAAALAVTMLVGPGLLGLTGGTPSPAPSDAAAPAATPATPAAPASPAAPALPAGAPSVTDTAGRAVPAAVATGAQGLYSDLAAGNLPAVQARYAPSAALDAAPWAQVEPLLATPQAREQLLAALRADPQRRTGFYRYAAAGAVVGVDTQGRMSFIALP